MGVVLLIIALTVLDQLTKQVVRDRFMLGESLEIIPGLFSLTYVRNTGAAWGMLGGQNTALIVLSLVMLVVLAVFRRAFLAHGRGFRVAYALMIAGILGNLFDRVRLGWVTDFLDFYVGRHHWPVFNVADSAICIGVGLYIFFSFKQDREQRNRSTGTGPASGPAETPPEP